jgi:hypothetical protein
MDGPNLGHRNIHLTIMLRNVLITTFISASPSTHCRDAERAGPSCLSSGTDTTCFSFGRNANKVPLWADFRSLWTSKARNTVLGDLGPRLAEPENIWTPLCRAVRCNNCPQLSIDLYYT